MRNHETGLDYANADPSLHCNIIDPSGPDWRNEYMKLLMAFDYEGAHKLRVQNDPVYASEVEPQVTVMRTEHKPIQSNVHVQIERDEMEAA